VLRRPQAIESIPRTCARTESNVALIAFAVVSVFGVGFATTGLFGLAFEAMVVASVLLGTMSMSRRQADLEDRRLPRAEASFRLPS
jgi:hypothetical protein